jgi:homoserine dehydrogenase
MPRKDELLHVILLGLGNVGRELVGQIGGAQARYPWLRLSGIADRSGLWVVPDGIPLEECAAALGHKQYGMPLTRWRPGVLECEMVPGGETYSPDLVWRLDEMGLRRAAVVDVTGSQDLYPLHLALRRAGHHLVLANKWPLVVPYDQYLALWRGGKGAIRHETTVGAALPVIRPLENLVATGDRIDEILACISGTMGFVASATQRGTPFSAAVGEAAARGYTETDPRLDLGGVDARRKALILARKIGQPLNLEDVTVESLVPPELEEVSLPEFWERLPAYDAMFADRIRAAAAEGNVLRYLAALGPDRRPWVGLAPVSAGSIFASTEGTESLFVFRTARYAEQPLVVRGQGAGGALTASGVLADILSIRAERVF